MTNDAPAGAIAPARLDLREGTKATLVSHCAVLGRREEPVRTWRVGPVRPHAQYPVSVTITFCGPRERRGRHCVVTPDNIRFYTVEQAGRVLYDSRTDVPCDMAEWRSCREPRKADWLRRKAEDEAHPQPAGVRIDSGYGRNPWEVE